MGKDERKGVRQNRSQRSKRIPALGYYFVVTDAKATEINYLQGLRDSIPASLRDRLVIKVSHAATSELLEKCMEMVAVEPQYRKPWIVFDRDQVKDFDRIIANAENRDVYVGWSNPCIEIWFHAYFSDMPASHSSMQCVRNFEKTFQSQTGQKYEKAHPDIYRKLCHHGNESTAIQVAASRHRQQCEICAKPSDMSSASTLYLLVAEIREKIEQGG
jgi:hypothetical protein